MVHTTSVSCSVALVLLEVIPPALSHGGDHGSRTTGAKPAGISLPNSNATPTGASESSYFAHTDHRALVLSHIGLMVVAWFFVLPIGVMLSIARSQLALIVQLSFLGLHIIGVIISAAYSAKTPDLYNNNAHEKIGWIVTWLVAVQCVIGLFRLAANIDEPNSKKGDQPTFPTISSEALIQHEQSQPYRYSNDSGHFTASDSSRSQSISSLGNRREEEQQRKLEKNPDNHMNMEAELSENYELLSNAQVRRFTSCIAARLSKRMMKVLNMVYEMIDYLSLPLGFLSIVSGAVVFGGVFRGNNVFNGLAHSIKGGIFFWYGLLTLGRWMGCFADMGWAWNVKPPVGIVTARKARVPSAEFVESFVIFLYGASNVWLEHLAAWGSFWSAQDFEHVSISIMFFGGGLCGMLVESKRIRDHLNTTILMSPAAYGPPDTRELLAPPRSYPFSMNPFPGLIIFLLGLMMSSHHQSSVVSTMIHKQWGMLFVGFAMARAMTYVLTYISPPSSYLPSRPPSELISSFCLISGGLLFIASNKDTVAAMEHHDLHAMFPFTITVGFTASLMAWAIVVLTVKGWAVRRQKIPSVACS